MKKLVMLCLLLACGIGFSQNSNKGKTEMRKERADLTPEQIASLQTKKLTLHLDLSEKQQKEVQAVQLEIAEQRIELQKKRKTKAELTNDEKFELKEKMLSDQITIKKRMKDILTEEQYTKWEKAKGRQLRTKRRVKAKKQ